MTENRHYNQQGSLFGPVEITGKNPVGQKIAGPAYSAKLVAPSATEAMIPKNASARSNSSETTGPRRD